MERRITIIGGDLRIVKLVKLLLMDNFEVFIYGLEKAQELKEQKNLNLTHNIEEAIQKSNIVVSSIPFSQDGNNIVAPYCIKKIEINELSHYLYGKILFAGKIPEDLKQEKKIITYDLLDVESYSILNAIATAEGAIEVAMRETQRTLTDSKTLIMGFGRIGKVLAKKLQGIGVDVYCEARKDEDLAFIKAYGYKPINLNELNNYLAEFDIIINNIPVEVLSKERLDLLKKDVVIIDLASSPGGVDFEYAKQKKIKTIWALGLPGKVAPESSAEYIKKTIYNILKIKTKEGE